MPAEKIAAILAADVVGYSRLMGLPDEQDARRTQDSSRDLSG